MFSIEYTHELSYRVTDIAYGIVAIIKKTYNYENDQSPVNAYYQTPRELRELRTVELASDTASLAEGSFTLDRA